MRVAGTKMTTIHAVLKDTGAAAMVVSRRGKRNVVKRRVEERVTTHHTGEQYSVFIRTHKFAEKEKSKTFGKSSLNACTIRR